MLVGFFLIKIAKYQLGALLRDTVGLQHSPEEIQHLKCLLTKLDPTSSPCDQDEKKWVDGIIFKLFESATKKNIIPAHYA